MGGSGELLPKKESHIPEYGRRSLRGTRGSSPTPTLNPFALQERCFTLFCPSKPGTNSSVGGRGSKQSRARQEQFLVRSI